MPISPPLPAPGTGRAHGAAIIGVEGHLVQVTARISNGPPAFSLSGVPETSSRETRDRVRAAIVNSAQPWPGRTITVSLLPVSLPKHGSGFDLAIAIAVLTAAGTIPAVPGWVRVRRRTRPGRQPAPGPRRPAGRCSRRPPPDAPGRSSQRRTPPRRRRCRAWLSSAASPCRRSWPGYVPSRPARSPPAPPEDPQHLPRMRPSGPGLAALGVPPMTRLALEAAAAGGHHLCVTGPPGAAIPALAAGLTALLPPLDPGEAVEVSAIHSVAGLLASRASADHPPAVTCPAPYRHPGGAGRRRPGDHPAGRGRAGAPRRAVPPGRPGVRGRCAAGAAPAAALRRGHGRPRRQHGGVPGQVHPGGRHGAVPVRRAARLRVHPAAGPPVPGPLRRRARQLHRHLAARRPARPSTRPGSGEPGHAADAVSAARVAAARERARRRLDGTPWRVNADIPGAQLRRCYQPTAEALAPISRAVDLGEISPRAAHQIIRVAWTLADLAGETRPGAPECGLALAFQLGVAR